MAATAALRPPLLIPAPACGDGPALLASMSTRDKLAQLLMVGVTGAADARAVVDSQHVGGIMIGSWTDLSMLSDGSLTDIANVGRPAAAGGERRRGGRPGIAAGPADRQPAVASGAGGQTTRPKRCTRSRCSEARR